MLTAHAQSRAHRPTRILRPAAILRRLRPVRLGALTMELTQLSRKLRGVRLIERHFPQCLPDVLPSDDWVDVQNTFFRLVEAADWFPIDWAQLETWWEFAMQEYTGALDPQLEPVGFDYLTDYLYGIPVQYFGYSEEAMRTYDDYPAVGLLAYAVGHIGWHAYPYPSQNATDRKLIKQFRKRDPAKVLARLAQFDPVRHPEPLCWLPDLVALATNSTGHWQLDTAVELGEVWPRRFTWDNPADLAHLREAWQAVKPQVQRLNQFMDWATDITNLQQILRVLLGVTDE